jgi:hypothetical protein
MTVFLMILPGSDEVVVRAPLVSEDGRTKGTYRATVRSGEKCLGYSYDELLTIGNGRHELEPRAPLKSFLDAVAQPAAASRGARGLL